MNRKGFSGVGCYAFLGTLSIMAVAAGVLRSSHIERRTEEKCIQKGNTQQHCEALVKSWTQKERLEYLKDTQANPTRFSKQY